MFKNYLIISIFLVFSSSILAQNTKSSLLFSCNELMLTIKNKADRTKINFNGNIEDFTNDIMTNIIKPGIKDYLTNLYSTANRDVSLEEREIIASQSIECMKKINWDFNNSNSKAKKKESYDKDDSEYFDFAMIMLSQFLRSNSSQNNNVFGSNNSNSRGNSNNSSVCNQCRPSDPSGHLLKDFNISTRTYSNFRRVQRPGYQLCKSCWGTGLQSQTGPKTCNQCNGDRFLVCNNCRGSGRRN